LVAVLKATGQLDDTYIIYTSDNGFQLGQHRLVSDKRQLYEHDIRVPLIVRGPNVQANSTIVQAVLNIDLAPTILDIATSSARPHREGLRAVQSSMDGRSFLPLLHSCPEDPPSCWRDDFLVSYHGEGDEPCGMLNCPPPPPAEYHEGDATNNTYHCVRRTVPQRHAMYCRFDDDENFLEYYDLEHDPWQQHNAANALSLDERFEWEMRLLKLRRCQGDGCRENECK
jgi:N-acetylglucosamine-6-sulfatase